ETYRARRALLEPALRAAGGTIHGSQAGLYLWTTFGEEAMTSVERLADHGILVAPGMFYGEGGEISYGSRSPRPTNGSLPPPGASSASRHLGAPRRRPDPTTHNGEPMDHATTSAHLSLGEKSLDLPTVP